MRKFALFLQKQFRTFAQICANFAQISRKSGEFRANSAKFACFRICLTYTPVYYTTVCSVPMLACQHIFKRRQNAEEPWFRKHPGTFPEAFPEDRISIMRQKKVLANRHSMNVGVCMYDRTSTASNRRWATVGELLRGKRRHFHALRVRLGTRARARGRLGTEQTVV